MSALDEIEFPWLEASELQAFLGRRGVFAICVRRFYVEARGHGLPGAQWATRNEIAAAPEVVVEVWRYRKRTTFSKRRSFSAWTIDARQVLLACLQGTPKAAELAEAVLATVRLEGDPTALVREARGVLRSRRHRS